MKLYIIEKAWGITNNGYSERVTVKCELECAVKIFPEMGNGKRVFSIDRVEKDNITVTVHCKNEKYNKTFCLCKGDKLVYSPRSFDGGYKYLFELE